MSDNIPFEIQTEIMKFLPIKSLIQFRSVSKSWNSLITSSDFIADYNSRHTQPPEHLVVSYIDQSEQLKYVSFVDDAFPLQNFPLKVPVSVGNLPNKLTMLDGSNGLFFLYNRNSTTAVIWNPAIHKSVDIDLPEFLDSPYEHVFGFGVSPHTLDPMIVEVHYFNGTYEDFCDKNFLPWQVEVYTLSTGVWRLPLSDSLPRESIQLNGYVVDFNGFLYFLACEWIYSDEILRRSYLIISFEMKSEEFTEIRLPNRVAYDNYTELTLCKLRESLVVFEFDDEDPLSVVNVWMIENDVQRSVTKLFAINLPDAKLADVYGFRKTGELLIYVITGDGVEQDDGLFVYQPYSKNMSHVGVSRRSFSFLFAAFYVETLLLLNH